MQVFQSHITNVKNLLKNNSNPSHIIRPQTAELSSKYPKVRNNIDSSIKEELIILKEINFRFFVNRLLATSGTSLGN